MQLKFVRFNNKGRSTAWGILNGSIINPIEGNVFGDYRVSGESVSLNDVTLLAPCVPSKAVCIGKNYNDHKSETEMDEPILFLKPPTSLNHPNGIVEYPVMTSDLQFEAELAVVIKKTAKYVSEENAYEYIMGYTCANDITARDLQRKDGQWTRSKSFDGFMPIGPCLETDIDPHRLDIKLYLNDEVRQSSNTCNLIFKIPRLIAFVSQVMTLYPGDVILTGSPSGPRPMKAGDRVVVEIEGIGRLENQIG